MMSCAAAIASESAMKPVQSNSACLRSVCSESANHTAVMAAMPGGTIMKNAPRQLYSSAIMLPTTGPITGPATLPTPHSIMTSACMWRGNVASRTAWPIGMIGAPNTPWPTR